VAIPGASRVPLLSTIQLAAQGLADPRAYIGSVFPGGN